MRAVNIARRVIPLIALVAVMAVPSAASATYWGEYDYQPIGGTPTSEDPVTAEIAGALNLNTVFSNVSVTCDVVGEIELKNDWDHPSGSPATNRILNLGLAGSVSQSCTGTSSFQGCPLSDVTFPGLPWSGHGEYGVATFTGAYASIKFRGGYGACTTAGPIINPGDTLPDVFFLANGSGQGDCLDFIGLYDSWFEGELGSYYPTKLNGELWIDHDTIEGLSTDEGGPCITINE